jgi:hypothetical protein
MGARTLQIHDQNFQTLRAQLSHFGLNPLEWIIFARKENSYEFSHRKDPAFKINVKVRALRTGLIRVDQLSVISL